MSRRAATARNVGRLLAWWFLQLVVVVVASAVVGLALRETLVGVFRVPSGSMIPAVLPGDVVVANRIAYDVRLPFTDRILWHRADPQPGDVVVVRSALVPGTLWVKRVVGVGGQTVRFEDGFLEVGDAPTQLTPRGEGHEQATRCRDERARRFLEVSADTAIEVWLDDGIGNLLRDTQAFEIPDGEVFLAGDFRDRSTDSRRVGPVPATEVVGRVERVLVSLDPCTGHERGDRRWMVVPARAEDVPDGTASGESVSE
ncbi:MAG: signal peptidase I [Alphaproteobacteria bacterium]|nr:signal peptidase I [Alphaproteobacteria bacterium]